MDQDTRHTPPEERGLVKYQADGQEVTLSRGIVRKYLVNGTGQVSDQEVVMFMQLCRYQQLNPFLKEAYLIKYGDNPATLVTSKHVFTKRAAAHPAFDGMESGVIVIDQNGDEVHRKGSLVLEGHKLVGAWARVHRKDRAHPTEETVSMTEYIGRQKDGTPNKQWRRMPATMIKKVAEHHALRNSFPDQFEGLYSEEESAQQQYQEIAEEPEKPKSPRDSVIEKARKQTEEQTEDVEDAEVEEVDAPAQDELEIF